MRTRSALLCFGMSLLMAWLPACSGRSELDLSSPDAGDDLDDAGGGGGGAAPEVKRSGKVDLLFVIDNSKNTDVEHALLGRSFPYLLDRLASPSCVNGLGEIVA